MKPTFFLGGSDLEMHTIRQLLEAERHSRFHDKKLAWGARASAYRHEIVAARSRSETLVLVELENDLALSDDECIFVDHHQERASGPSSLRQVFDLLQLPAERWTRWLQLVEANDVGAMGALKAVGASDAEIRRIRSLDRACQGISALQEEEARQAVKNAVRLKDGLLFVECPHSRTAPVADLLDPAFGGPGYRELLILSPDEINFYGGSENVTLLQEKFPEGWSGGHPLSFWGMSTGDTLRKNLLQTVLQLLGVAASRVPLK